jgi:hypothetical protein
MIEKIYTWTEYKLFVQDAILYNFRHIYRGQSNSNHKLITSFHRLAGNADMEAYYSGVLPMMAERIEAITGKKWNLENNIEFASFLSFLQHHGFPTPLLDWTFSPYIATYFAFEGINDTDPETEFVTIYMFDRNLWVSDYPQIRDIKVKEPHVSVIEPHTGSNINCLIQQGTFTFTNQYDIEGHIALCGKQKQHDYLFIIKISCKEKPNVMKELKLMGITAMSLFPDVYGVCKYGKEETFAKQFVNMAKFERSGLRGLGMANPLSGLNALGSINPK